ncbi:MAG: DUF2971 domain-containing protein [Hyphomonadaceae bacterium]
MVDSAMNLTPGQFMTSVFMPEYFARSARLVGGGRLVHYTSAEAAMKIVQAKSVWLRNVTLMNDFSEIDYGIEYASRALGSEPGKRFIAKLSALDTHGVESALASYDNWVRGACKNTYIVSLSDHDDCEDLHGRLSMWRAYGGTSSVALVMNSAPFVTETDALGAFSTSVEYKELSDVDRPMTQRLLTLEANLQNVAQQKEWVSHFLSQMLLGAALGVKHPGFGEEREWRVYHLPGYYPDTASLQHQIVCLKGIPRGCINSR